MWLVIYYVVFMILGDLVAYLIGLGIEHEWGSTASLWAFLALYFFSLYVAWILAVWMTKETMWQTIDSPSFRHALDMENRTQVMCTQTGELSAAAEAFREGRAPEWSPL